METMEIDQEQNYIANSLAERAEKKAADKQSLPWVEKYRPSNLDELIAHDDIRNILKELISNKKLPHLLFYGPPGTGKTSTIVATAKMMYNDQTYSSNVLELNASDDRGIDVVREQIKEFAGTKRLFSDGIKLIILDEADAMTSDAQAALRRVIEKYTSNTRFCLICNYVNKIIPALQSRCTRFRFSPLKPDQIESRLRDIVRIENVTATEGGLQSLMQLANGDMRRVLNLLQSTHMAYPEVSEETVYLTAGAAIPAVIDNLIKSLFNDSFQQAYNLIYQTINEFGYALCDIVTEISLKISKKDLPDAAMAFLMDRFSNLEYRLSHGVSEKLQVGALVGAFISVRSMIKV